MPTRLIPPTLILLLTVACGADPPPELDLTPYHNRICDLLPLDQLAAFNVNHPGTPATDPTSLACLWQSPNTKILVRLENHIDPTLTDDVGTINNFPAKRWNIPGKGTTVACATTIDTRRHQYFTAIVYAPKDACAASDTIAHLVITNIQSSR